MDELQIHESVFESKIAILSRDCLTELAAGLYPKKVIPTESGHLRDWRGLADICGLRGCEIEQCEQRIDPACQLLQRLQYDLSVSKLLYHLEELDRYDIIEDCWEKIEKCLLSQQRRLENEKKYPRSEYQPVTMQDIAAFESGQPLVTYDAFVLYADDSPKDSEFANDLRQKLEDAAFKVCSRDDLIPGMHSEINALTGLIKHRCKVVIMILTEELFHKSSVNTWLVNVTITIGFDQPKKIIPCRIDPDVKIPESLAPITKLDFCNKNVDSYKRLIDSINLLSKQGEASKETKPGPVSTVKAKSGRNSSRLLDWLVLRKSSSHMLLDDFSEEERLLEKKKNKEEFEADKENLRKEESRLKEIEKPNLPVISPPKETSPDTSRKSSGKKGRKSKLNKMLMKVKVKSLGV